MDGILIKPIGQIAIQEPDNWCSISDLTQAWIKVHGDKEGGGVQEIRQARICAAALGMCWAREGNPLTMPTYDFARGNVYVYGATVQDRLLRKGVKLDDLATAGISIFGWLQSLMPTREEEQNAEDFSEAAGANKTSSV